LKKPDEFRQVLWSCKGYFATAASFSLAINLLYLAGPLYMLQVYDRVLSSASKTTLVMLTLALLIAFAALAGLDSIRGKVLTRASIRLDRALADRVVSVSLDAAPRSGAPRSQPIRDFDTVRQFITGAGIHALLDLPWAPIYIAVIFVLHPVLGSFAFGSAVVLVLMALLSEFYVRRPLAEANEAGVRSHSFTEMSGRNAEVIRAMGMLENLIRRWRRDRDPALAWQAQANERAASTAGVIRFMRMSVQSLILGLGAYLVIERDVTVGAMFAATILLGRAMQPVEQIVGAWRGMLSAQSAYRRLRTVLSEYPIEQAAIVPPQPEGRVSVENVSYAVRGRVRPVLYGINLHIEPGEVVGVIGPSGAGKSTLARHIVGVLAPSDGVVRLDGANVANWPRSSFGRHVGYLPQDVELFADTVAANIRRFGKDDDEGVIAAAELAGAHEIILRLPNGYETEIGEGGAILSGGYRQRIGLARAVYGDPSLVVLDEPNSNLDSIGDAALSDCVEELKRRGTTVVIVSHRPSTLAVVDKILVIRDGMAEMFGPQADVIARLTRVPQTVSASAAA
jgi:PrtD family type I secretion system ABC transporter